MSDGKSFTKHVLWILLLFLTMVLLFSHNYNDLLITTRHGINFWSILIKGNIINYYSENITASGNMYYNLVQGCAYNIIIYIIFAIWNIPLALLMTFTDIDVMNNIFCLTWAKLLPVVFFVISCFIMKKIFEEMKVGADKNTLMLYLYCSSAVVLSVIFLICQYDVISLVFQLLGFLAYLKNKNKAFILWFGIAVCCKFFALLIFLPLLLLKEKNIWKLFGKCILMMIPLIITKLPFMFSTESVQSGSSSFMFSMITMLFSNETGFSYIFIVVYICILVWCFLSDKKDFVLKSTWACFVTYTAFFGLCTTYPYWSILMIPFIILVVAVNPKNYHINILIEMIVVPAFVCSKLIYYYWCYIGDTMKPMIWSYIIPAKVFGNNLFNDLLLKLREHPQTFISLQMVFVAGMLAMAYINYPKKNNEVIGFSWKNVDLHYDILYLRFGIIAFLCLIPIFSLFIP